LSPNLLSGYAPAEHLKEDKEGQKILNIFINDPKIALFSNSCFFYK